LSGAGTIRDVPRKQLAATLRNLFIEVCPLAKGLPCAACGETITGEGYHYVSAVTGLPGLATHVREPCCSRWLAFDNRRGRFRDEAVG